MAPPFLERGYGMDEGLPSSALFAAVVLFHIAGSRPSATAPQVVVVGTGKGGLGQDEGRKHGAHELFLCSISACSHTHWRAGTGSR